MAKGKLWNSLLSIATPPTASRNLFCVFVQIWYHKPNLFCLQAIRKELIVVIPAGSRQLRRAFFKHVEQAKKGTSPSHYLLLFYAVECGLKSIYLNVSPKNIRTTNDIPDEHLRRSHDLARWALKLRLPVGITGANTSFRLRSDNSSWSISYAHEVWRYGIAMQPADEQRLVRWLNEVYQWIKEKL